MIEIKINQEPIELSKILKLANIVSGGGEAKVLICEGLVCVNGDIESRKRKKIYANDVIQFQENTYIVVLDDISNDNEKIERKNRKAISFI